MKVNFNVKIKEIGVFRLMVEYTDSNCWDKWNSLSEEEKIKEVERVYKQVAEFSYEEIE